MVYFWTSNSQLILYLNFFAWLTAVILGLGGGYYVKFLIIFIGVVQVGRVVWKVSGLQ